MRFLHTADLHIGKRIFDVNLLEEQRQVLNEIREIAGRERCDSVLIAGDIYDRTNPSAEAMGVFDAFVSALVSEGISVYAISGNHDSGDRVNYLSGLIEERGVYIEGDYQGKLCCHRLSDEFGELNLYLLPFVKPVSVRSFFPEEEIVTYADAVQKILEREEIDPAERNVIVSHQFVTGASTCDSEEFAIGGLDNIPADVYKDFDYTALGHIHGPQNVGDCRYSGTPLKYSFSEAVHKKSVTIVEMGEKGEVAWRPVELHPVHDLRRVKGGMEELMDMPFSEDYLEVTVTDEEVPPDARITLAAMFPNMLKFRVENSRTVTEWEQSEQGDFENKGVLEMIEDFYRYQNHNVEMSEDQRRLMLDILDG